MAKGAISASWDAYGRYDYFDETDGKNPQDTRHSLLFGLEWKNAVFGLPRSKLTIGYNRMLEYGWEETYPNDMLWVQGKSICDL